MKKENIKQAGKTARSRKKKSFAFRFSVLPAWLKGFVMVFCIVAGGFCLISFGSDVVLYTQLKAENSTNTALLEQALEKKEELETTKKNLTNPDYLEYVARGRYYVSRDDEQVFVFPNITNSTGS